MKFLLSKTCSFSRSTDVSFFSYVWHDDDDDDRDEDDETYSPLHYFPVHLRRIRGAREQTGMRRANEQIAASRHQARKRDRKHPSSTSAIVSSTEIMTPTIES